MRPPPQGQVVINLKTTITAHGGHSGVIVHSGIQSAGSAYSHGSSSGSLWSLGPGSRIPQIETPGGTRLTEAASPLPLTIGPSTSQDHLNTSWTRPYPSPQPPQRSGSYDHIPYGIRDYERPRVVESRRPATPPSPVYDFTGRNTPPQEFIEPSRITLNVFEPGKRTPVPYDVGLRQSNLSTADALINDTVTTTTTVEVFRTPLDQPFVSLPPPPAPGLDDRPQLLRLDGPPYEKWSSTRSETLINDRPVGNKAVKWKEKLTDRNSELEYDGNRLVDSRSPFSNVSIPSRPPSASHQYYIPTIHHVDERLVPPMVHRSTSPYMVQSPSEFSMTSHPMITNGYDERHRSSSTRVDSALSYHQPIRTFEFPSNTAQLRVQSYGGVNGNTPILSQTSPVYVEPNRTRERPQQREVDVDRYGYSTVDRRTSARRAKSSHRGRTRAEELRARSVSPLSRRPSWADDPNRLPNMPRCSDSRDAFHLYETRDAFDNIVSQFSELEMFDMGAGLLLSPLAESEESIISETSARNDRARADLLENRPAFDIYKIADQFYQNRNPLMMSKSADHIYERPRAKEAEEEHIYEELDSIREATSTSNLAQIYHTVANDYEYEEIPPPLPPRRRREKIEERKSRSSEIEDSPPPPIAKETVNVPQLSLSPDSSQQEEERPKSLHFPVGSSSEEEDPRRPAIPISDSGSTLSTTTADSSDSGDGLSFIEEEWPPPPQILKRPRKAHPDGHVFPRITSSVSLMPRLPEDKELSSSQEESGGISLTPLHLEVFDREPKPASPVFPIETTMPMLNIPEITPGDKSPGSTGSFIEEEDLPFVDASPRITSPKP